MELSTDAWRSTVFSRRFDIRLTIRLSAFVCTTFGFVWIVERGGMPTTAFLMAASMLWAGLAVWFLARRTNAELARFITALQQRDLSQSFAQAGRGGGFDDIGRAFDEAFAALRTVREQAEVINNFAGALIDGAPTPLLTIDDYGRVEMANKAARRMFARVTGARIDSYALFGGEFVESLRSTVVGRRSTRLIVDGLPQRTTLTVTTVDRKGAPWRIVSVHVIQHELDQAELATQMDLVRVLTHEIMNSMTPVTSLAASAARLMNDIDDGADPTIADVRVAIDTLARRAAGTTRFVETYQEFARTPAITIALFEGRAWSAELARLFVAHRNAGAVRLDICVPDAEFTIRGDIGLLTQVVLNLLKNGGEAAAASSSTPRVKLGISPIGSEGVRVNVTDNGSGIPEKYIQDIFLPFFTTKPEGTGVGLSFARQIVLLHGGRIDVVPSADGGSIEFIV